MAATSRPVAEERSEGGRRVAISSGWSGMSGWRGRVPVSIS